MLLHLATGLLATVLVAAQPWRNTSLSFAERVENLVSLMSIEELVANLDAERAPGCSRLGLKPYRFDMECERGAVTSGINARPLGTGFPCPLALGGTFNLSLLVGVARVSAVEVRAYYNLDVLANKTSGGNCYAPVSRDHSPHHLVPHSRTLTYIQPRCRS
jgi:beta-glucosidase